MKVVFPTCCGVDVHKSFLVATINKTPKDSLQPSYQKKRFSTFNSDLNRFADWLRENDCLDVCMESTGKYWVPVFNILEKRGIRAVSYTHLDVYKRQLLHYPVALGNGILVFHEASLLSKRGVQNRQ